MGTGMTMADIFAEDVVKHLLGQHDQKTHGNWAHGASRNMPAVGEGFSEWRDRLWEGVKRGEYCKDEPAYYRAMSDGEFKAALEAGEFRPLMGNDLYVTSDPDRLAGGAYGGNGGGYIVQFKPDLKTRTAGSRTVSGLEETVVDRASLDDVVAVYRWDPERQDHVRTDEDFREIRGDGVTKHYPGGKDHDQLHHGNRSYVIAESAEAKGDFKDARDVADNPKRIKRVWMPPQEYLRLCETFQGPIISQDRPTIDSLRARIRGGKPLTVPWLELNPDGVFFGQDGRHRARAAQEEGLGAIPVDMVLLGSDWDSQLDLLERAGVMTVPEPKHVVRKAAEMFADAVLEAIAKDKGWVPGPNAHWQRIRPAMATATRGRTQPGKTQPASPGQLPFAQDVPRFETKDEAYQWLAKNVGVRAISDDRLSLEELQQLADGCYAGVRDFQKEVPAMRIKTSGAGAARIAAWGEDNTLLLNLTAIRDHANRKVQAEEAFRSHKESVLGEIKAKLDAMMASTTEPSAKARDLAEKYVLANVCKRWSMAMDTPYFLETVYAHEMGHRLQGWGDFYWAWEEALRKNKVSSVDRFAVSEYGAESANDELFAEVHAAVSTGREAELPASVRKAYRDWLKATYRKERS